MLKIFVLDYLKNKFGDGNIKKIFNFSDGAASQYKNKFNFRNLSKHRDDFGISAQWNPRSLFKWAQTHFRNIHFNFCPLNDHELHDKTLKAHFEQRTTIKNTRQYHCFEPVNNKILCRLFSKDSVFVENVISGKRNKK